LQERKRKIRKEGGREKQRKLSLLLPTERKKPQREKKGEAETDGINLTSREKTPGEALVRKRRILRKTQGTNQSGEVRRIRESA